MYRAAEYQSPRWQWGFLKGQPHHPCPKQLTIEHGDFVKYSPLTSFSPIRPSVGSHRAVFYFSFSPCFIEVIDTRHCINLKCTTWWSDFPFLFNQPIISTTGCRYLPPSQGLRTPKHNRSLWHLPCCQRPHDTARGWGQRRQAPRTPRYTGAGWDLPQTGKGLTDTSTEQEPEGKSKGDILFFFLM